jgi:hypothetical protein
MVLSLLMIIHVSLRCSFCKTRVNTRCAKEVLKKDIK